MYNIHVHYDDGAWEQGYTYAQERIRGGGERACNFRQERIGPVVQAKSLGRTKNRGCTVVSCGGRR